MMPKFRAYVKPLKKMLPVANLTFYAGEDTPVSVSGCGDGDCQMCIDDYSLDDVTLMQSTGVKDVNGVEIYEGDVVKVTDGDGNTDFCGGGIGSVCGLADLLMWYIGGDIRDGLFNTLQIREVEIIGNIHENPELLSEVE